MCMSSLFRNEKFKKTKSNLGVKSLYRSRNITADTGIKFDPNGPFLNGSIVLSHNKWLLGYRYSFGVTKMAFLGNSLSLGYDLKDISIRASLDNSDLTTSLFHKIDNKLNGGVSVRWMSYSDSPLITFGVSYQVDRALCIKAKINNELNTSIGVRHELRPGVYLGLSTTIDGANMSSGKHKFGASLEFATI
ncbi:hypothetical protein GJ496_002185 [Pomphorhynchus laevis]|nr:hypothetical protein GJ496_002185 [Pomphorhynchus laevis]